MSDTAASIGSARAVHQMVPALIPRDATGSHTLLLRQALRAAGWRSEIYAEATHDELLAESVPVERYAQQAAPGDVLIYQFSTSSMVADLLAGRDEPLIVDYHNVTGPEHYQGWDDAAADRSAEALVQLHRLGPRASLGMADSSFNAASLRAAGCRHVAVVPVLVDHDRVASSPDPATAARLANERENGGAEWLFVGRLVPSKGQHQLIKALWAYRRLYDPKARLRLVGLPSAPQYFEALVAFTEELGLTGAVSFPGEVSDAELAAYFQSADVYVSLSVHEGFGVPLIEAMRAGVPVVALGTGAVPGTVGDAGLVLEHGEPSYVAGVVQRIVSDAVLRERLVSAGHAQVASLALDRCARLAVEAVAAVAGAPPVADVGRAMVAAFS